MFDKLRNKFVVINMCLLTFVFVSIFSAIYLLTANSARRQTEFTLEKAIAGPIRPFPENPAMGSVIIVELDREGEIIHSFSFMNIDANTISRLTQEAQAANRSRGNITLGETYYGFLKGETLGEQIKIAFIDRTPQQRTLHNLLLVFITVGGISLIVLFFISLYFANRTVAPIKDVFEKQKQFIADASHELKTPLAVIKTNAALVLANEEQTVDSQKKWLQYILFQANKMAKLLDEMLSLARYDYTDSRSGASYHSAGSQFDLSTAVTSCALSFEGFMFEKRIELHTDIQPDINFTGDKESIKRLVDILMDNAVKHTPEEGKVYLSLTSAMGQVQLKVVNTGAGISPEHLDKIFERFYRIDASRTGDSGYGLGLSIAKAIVQQHQGKITVESNPGVDTTFMATLPLRSPRNY